jgi:hypothetical protein
LTDSTRRPDNWSDWQNDEVVREYFKLDDLQRVGGRLVKQDLYREIGAIIDRKPGGVENKFQNISAVLSRLKMDYAEGLSPRFNIQQSLADAVERYLDIHPKLVFGDPQTPNVDPASVEEVSAPDFVPVEAPLERTVERIARKYNHAERDARNRKLGELGEKLVCQREQKQLILAGKEKLAEKVRWVSKVDGDGVGYDIRSFDPSGEERLIEVKTTNGPATTDFFLSRTERDVSLERPDIWRLHRVHLFSSTPRIFIMPPPLEAAVTLRPENWRATFRAI